ncbi:hypothetical protein ADN00_12250 [Ornatilinea apprima]|uniref:DegV family protein n=1 Tax=Ornatilinea apprima TaxID=1134406 RepID=A0A0P6XLR6_9CHLR|nr:DegV family protein [Ornatilinea apprima]KPL76105.1 hypothetical protein ADN00_12250 [Ornatilinea apprima]
MRIVTDRGADLADEQLKDLEVDFLPLMIYFEGNIYKGGEDLTAVEFYQMLEKSEAFPSTSQPSPGDFAKIYRKLADMGEEIFSLHISSGLSGTMNAAMEGAKLVPEAKVTFYDSKTLSVPLGWQVEAAAKMFKAGWPLEKVIKKLDEISEKANGFYTLSDLKYLVHGGRISHLKGLIASLLKIKPVIGVDKITGKYETFGQEITLKRAVGKMLDVIEEMYGASTELRVQLLNGHNPEGLAYLKEKISQRFKCKFEPSVAIAPVLGAHTGPSMIGLSVAPLAVFADLP